MGNVLPAIRQLVKPQFTRRLVHRCPVAAETKDYPAIIAINVRALMRAAGWSERDLGKRAGLAPKSVNNIVNGKHIPGVTNLTLIARAFAVPPWVLFLEDMTTGDSARSIERLVSLYSRIDHAGRDLLTGVAERAASYRSKT